MDRKFFIEMGFKPYAIMMPSDKYTQGIDLWYPSKPIKDENQPAVYILTKRTGEVLKIGETQNLHSRFYRNYRLVSNTTNNRIREHVREVEDVYVYVLTMPVKTTKIGKYTCTTSFAKGLEHCLLEEYKEKVGELPSLNSISR